MTKRILGNFNVLVLGLVVMSMAASAQEAVGIRGIWLANITPVDCQAGAVIANAVPFVGMYLFSNDGSMKNEAAFLVASPLRSSGLGTWRHIQGRTYTSKFRFYRYNPDGSFLAMREVSLTIELNGDQFTSKDKFQDFDADNKPLPAAGCNVESAMRLE